MALEVAKTIYQQIGNKTLLLTGSKDFIGGENSLHFTVNVPGALYKIRIILTAYDTYTLTFHKFQPRKQYEETILKEVSGLYFDSLGEVVLDWYEAALRRQL